MLVSSFNDKLIKLPNQFSHLLMDFKAPKKKPPRNVLLVQRISFKSQNSVMMLSKNNYNLALSFNGTFENESIDISALKRVMKRMKYINLLSFSSAAKSAAQLAAIANVAHIVYNKLRGMSSPLIVRQEQKKRLLEIKLLRKYKLLNQIRIDTTQLPEALDSHYSGAHLSELEYSLKSLRYLESLTIIENFQSQYTEFIQLMARQLRGKKYLKKLELFVFQTMSRDKHAFNAFLKELKEIKSLEEVNLCIDGKEMPNKNIKQFCSSLSALPSLRKVKLTIIQPMVTRDYLRLNAIACLQLELCFKITSLQIYKLNLLKRLKMPISVKLEEIEDKRMADERFFKYIFKNISKVACLTQFTYTEDFSDPLSFCSRHHFVKNLELLAPRSFVNLSKLNLTFNNSLLIEFTLELIGKVLPRMNSLEGLTINVFGYKNFAPAEEAILSFLSLLPRVSGLKELYFSIEGEVNKVLSRQMINSISKCEQLRTFGNFSLQVDFELLLHFFSKISKMKALESLLLWLSPLDSNLERNIRIHGEELCQSAVDGLLKLTELENIQIKFPVSSIVNRELNEFKKRLSTRKRLNVQIDSLPIDIENFF